MIIVPIVAFAESLEKKGGLGADADQNFGWLLKFSCVAFAFRLRFHALTE